LFPVGLILHAIDVLLPVPLFFAIVAKECGFALHLYCEDFFIIEKIFTCTTASCVNAHLAKVFIITGECKGTEQVDL
jgi:hypothetical protein